MRTQRSSIHTFFSAQKGKFFADTKSTSKILLVLARCFYLYSSGYVRIPVKEIEISVGRRTFGGIFARIIQRAYRRYRKRPVSLAKYAWNAIRYVDAYENQRFPTRNFVRVLSGNDFYCI